MANFKSQDFKLKEIYLIVLSIFTRTLTGLSDLVVPASDGSEIQASVEDFRVIDENYLLSHTLLKLFVFVVCGLFIFQYTKLIQLKSKSG